ncbi:Cell division protein FtsL [compost metagenome]
MQGGTMRSNRTGQVPAKPAGARRRIRLWMSFMIVFIGWAGYTYFAQAGQIGAKSEQLSTYQASKAASEQSFNQLKYELDRLKDPEYIGQIAMKKYGLYRPGEIPVRVSDSGSQND